MRGRHQPEIRRSSCTFAVARRGEQSLTRFHAEVTRNGAGWLIEVKELSQITEAATHGEILPTIHDLLASNAG
jgi:hypothetical protein